MGCVHKVTIVNYFSQGQEIVHSSIGPPSQHAIAFYSNAGHIAL